MSELIKRIVLSKWWVGDIVYHRMTGDRGLITGVHFAGDKLSLRYFVVFTAEADGWCDEIELSAEKVFIETDESKVNHES